MYYLVSKCLDIFLLSLCYSFLVCPLWSKNTVCMISVLLTLLRIWSILVYGPEYGLYWYIFFGTWKEYVFCCCWLECSINVFRSCWLKVSLSSFSSLMFFCSWSISNCERSIEVSKNNCGFIFSPFSSINFCLVQFCTSVV